MATQTLEFSYPAGETITARLVLAGTNTEAPGGAAVSCTEMPNRIDRYSVQFSNMSNDVQIIIDNMGTEAAGGFYTLTDTNATFYSWAEQKPTSGSGAADGGNYYALNNTVRDGMTADPGWIAGDELTCEDANQPGKYVWILPFQGIFSSATEGVEYQFIPSARDGKASFAADTAALDVITNAGMIAGDITVLANTSVQIWKAGYAGDFSGAVDGTDYDTQLITQLDGGSHYAANNAARDQFFTDGLVAGDLIYNADESAKGTYIMLLPYTGPFGSATPGTTYQFISSPTVPPTSAIQQAANSVAY